MFKTQVLSYGFGSIKNKINEKVNKKNPLKTGPAMAGPDGQVATALTMAYSLCQSSSIVG